MEWQKNLTISDYDKLAGELPKSTPGIRSSSESAAASYIAANYPWIQPQTVSALSKYGASPEVIKLVGDASAMRELGQYDQKKNAVGETVAPIRYALDALGWAKKSTKAAFDFVVPGTASFLLQNVYDPFFKSTLENTQQYVLKPTVRWSTAVFDLVPEMAQNVASMVAGSSNYDLFGLWESTSLATMLDDWDNTGDGYFMSQTLREEQAKRARAFRGTIYGSAFTMGRALTQWAGKNSIIYKYGSGVIDAAVMLALPDPSLYVAKGLAKGGRIVNDALTAKQMGLSINTALRAGESLVPILTQADAKIAKQLLRDEYAMTHLEAGVSRGIDGESVDAEKFIKFMTSNPLAIKLVDTLVEKTNRQEILEDVFKFEITTDVADQLANAKTRNEVISALTSPFTTGEKTLDPKIGLYRVNKAKSALLKTRFFTEMPKGSIVVSGDQFDDLDAIRNMTLSMRTAGVADDVIKSWGDRAIQSFSSRGTQPAKFEAFREYNEAIAEILKANGIEQPVISNMFKRVNGSLDKVRSYLNDAMGNPTDNGYLQMMADLLKENGDDAVYAEFLERAMPIMSEASFAGPAKLVHMLDRTQVLPDARELRRLTRNPLFQKVFDAAHIDMGKLPIAGKRRSMVVTRFTDEGKVNELKDQLRELRGLPKAERTEAVVKEMADIEGQIERMTYTEKVRALTGEARMAVDIVDFMQNRIWKPLNLATIGYIVRNGIDAQIRMAFGGVRSLANSGVYHPLEFIHIAIGLPGKGTKYAKSITGVDMTNLGVAKKTFRGETVEELSATVGEFIYVGEERFPNTIKGLRAAEKLSKRTGKPLFRPELDVETMDNVTAATTIQQQLAQTLGNVKARIGFTQSDYVWNEVRTGSFPVYARGADGSYETSMHTKGVAEQMQMATKNETTRIVARRIAQGKNDQEIAEEIADWYLANQNSPAYKNIEAAFLQGFQFKSELHPGIDINAPINFREAFAAGREDIVRQALINHALAVDITSARQLTGKVPELEFLAAYDAIPDFANQKVVGVGQLVRRGKGTGSLREGNIVELDGQVGVVHKLDKASDDAEELATFIPFAERYSLTGTGFGKPSERARRLIESVPVSADGKMPGLPVRVPSEQIERGRERLGEFEQLSQATDYLTGFLFNVLNDTAVRRLERSVTFRQFYYQEVSKHLDRLTVEEGRRMYDDILAKAQAEGKTIREYLGEGKFQKKRVADKIESLATRTSSKGTMTVKELDDYSRFVGLSRTKELLYDATANNNMIDALRIVMPFAQAWKDVISTYMWLGAQHNIHMVRQFARVYKGLEQADPDQDGRGFLFRDPQTKEVQFHFPLSGSIAKLFTGIDAPLSAPLGRLSQGINIYPALGPYGQMAVSSFLPDTPKYNDVKELLLPYGETTPGELFAGILPGTIRKGLEAAFADTENRATTYGNVYIETIRALSVNPKYDLSTETGVNELLGDAKMHARTLTMMRMVSQFLGPSSGTQEWKVPTEMGDQYVGVLIEELRKFQLDDYDTAIDRFLQLYGDELTLYVGSKSRALRDGLEATQEFGDWERDNRDVLDTYTRTGGYFGPMGSEYNFSVWERQLQEKSRERLGDRELIAEAQKRVGSTKYRAMRMMFPSNPNEKQRAVLNQYRSMLHEQYPGFPIRPEYEVGKFANSIDELTNAVKDERLKDNPIIPQLKSYLKEREALLATKGGLSLGSQKKIAERTRLFMLGESLATQNPEFARIWTRLLSQEVE